MSGLEGLLAGRTLVKRYRIGDVIGRGGFAAVYRAEDERLGRSVAVKVITLAAPDDEAREHLRERFQREARSAASLPQHPNVVTVHDFGTDPELGLDFLVMEFLHGEDLATHLARQRKLPLESAIRILRDAMEGIAIGHRANLLHRDVKPGNIFLAEPHGEDPFRVCVLDFGIARVTTEGQDITRLTQGGGIPLSPAFASPEQLRGERNLTCASDVFSLGVVGYQLLTGEKPLRADRTVDPADWTPDRTLRELNPEIPEAVEAVVTRAMSFEAEERFQDAGAMAAALDQAMKSAPVPPAPVVVAPAVGAPAAAAGAMADDGEHTLVQPEWAREEVPETRPRTTISTPERVATRPAYAKWGVVLGFAALITVAGLWALSRGGPESDPGRGDVLIEEPATTEEPRNESRTRVTGEIMEDPASQEQDGIGSGSLPAFEESDRSRDGASPVSRNPGTTILQPSAPAEAPRQAPQQQGASPQPAPTPVTQPQQGQPQQPQTPAARPDTSAAAPPLLGDPVEAREPAPKQQAPADTTRREGAQ